MKRTTTTLLLLGGLAAAANLLPAQPQPPAPAPTPPAQAARPPAAKPDFPPAAEVMKGYEKVVSTVDGKPSFYTLYVRKKDQQMLAELPRAYAKQKHFIALTVAAGESYAGLQAGDLYVYWKQYGKRLALVQPNTEVRSTGDHHSQSSVKRLFTDRVLLDVPIVTVNPKGGPIIDFDALLVGQASKFFGGVVSGANTRLYQIKTAKAFPQNVEVAFELPARGGQLRTLHYSFSLMPDNTGYKPRQADERVGFFTTHYNDFGKYQEKESRVRYINRWHLEKADPKLKLSPPKEPIVFYIEHTTPVRYRRWVRDGVLVWNKAFEKVGLVNAIEVRYQDAKSGAHMEKDPEDVRYNFIRWLNNGIGTAIGPSRVHPNTGQILDADVILTDGWIRHWWSQANEILPQVATEGYGPETLAWLHQNPQWDPRVRLASPARREQVLAERALAGPHPELGGHPVSAVDPGLLGDQEYDGLIGRTSQVNGLCFAANCKSHGIATMMMALDIGLPHAGDPETGEGEGEGGEGGEPKEDDEQVLDGIPESFVGPLLVDLVAHEVGHTIGLRHNFKGSSIHSMAEINSPKLKGAKAFAGSVMDYLPVNIRMEAGEVQGDYAMIDIGPYDAWAIEYGYTFGDLKPVLARVAEPALQYATDEDTWGPDPLARRYDFGADPLAYAEDQMRLVRFHRGRILENFVKDGESWAKARRGYLLTLNTQTRAISMMANWVGGVHIYRDRKGDPNGRTPTEVVAAQKQRDALQFVIQNAFVDGAFGLTPELLRHMTIDQWMDSRSYLDDASWPVHDTILGIQASALTAVMNPSTLKQIYDNEARVPAEEDALTLPEVIQSLSREVWRDLEKVDPKGTYTARKPLISSFKRNLQREYLDRLTDLARPDTGFTAAYKPISDLAVHELRRAKKKITEVAKTKGLDPYTRAHLVESANRIDRTLKLTYTYPVR